jgi:hypothetical protein
MSAADKGSLSHRPSRYWTDDEEPVLALLQAIVSEEERKSALDMFHARRFDDLEHLLVQRQILLPDGTINKDYESLQDIWEDELAEIATEPFELASMSVDGFPASMNTIEARRIGWMIHYRHTSDDGIDDELDEDSLPCTLGDLVGWCTSVVEELRSDYAEDHSVDELEGRWLFTASTSLYPGLDGILEAEERRWLAALRKEREDDEMLDVE